MCVSTHPDLSMEDMIERQVDISRLETTLEVMREEDNKFYQTAIKLKQEVDGNLLNEIFLKDEDENKYCSILD